MTDIPEGLLIADGFDDALVGVGSRCGQPDVAVYDVDKCIDILMRNGLTNDEAREHFSFNVEGGWVGEQTPVWMRSLDDESV
jgi:beta-lactam-binding protein with PASTA domain